MEAGLPAPRPVRTAAPPQRLPLGWGITVGFLLLLLYFGNERSFLHRSAVEKAFWPFIYGWFALLWVSCHGRQAPMAPSVVGHRGYTSDLRDAALVVLAALMGLAVYMHNRTQRLASSISRRDLQHLAKPYVETIGARMAASRVSDLLSSRRRYMGLFQGLVFELVDAFTGRPWRVRGSLLKALQDCCKGGPQDLLYLLNCGDVDLPRLFTVAGTDSVLALLCEQVPHMDVVTKARLVDALHRQPDFRHLRSLQRLVARILRQTRGWELTTLKNLIDEIGDFYNLHRLVFHELVADLREDVLRHIEEEGRKLRLTRAQDGGWTEAPRKILSDIDDTLYCSGGRFPYGVDARFNRGQVYPGVLALFRELDRQRVDNQHHWSNASGRSAKDGKMPVWFRVSAGEWKEMSVSGTETVAALHERLAARRPSTSPCCSPSASSRGAALEVSFTPPSCRAMSNLAFLSARPHAYKDYTESKSFRLFRQLRARGRLHCMPTLLSGSLSASVKAALLSAVPQFKFYLCTALLLLLAAALSVHRRVLISLCVGLLAGLACTWAATRQQRYAASSAWRPVAAHKARTFLQYQRLYSECSTVFFGDNGQGDLWCGEQLLHLAAVAASEGQPRPITAVFIHEVSPRPAQLSSLPERLQGEEQAEAWRGLGVYFHRTYAGAAVNAYRCGLISQEALARVASSTVDDLVRIRIGADGRGHAWAERVAELNADVEQANELLPESLWVQRVPEAAGADEPFMSRPHSRSLEDFAFHTAPPDALEGAV